VETLTVVSYNIRYGKDIDQALSELREFKSQKPLDILLLQEMDEAGTEKMARELHLNYVYFPAAIEPVTKRNFGNAILSRWPIVDSHKRILPHKSFSHRMHRIATRATIKIHAAEILAYSIHTEPVFTLPQFKIDQYTAVLHDVSDEDMPVIVGGDFNSFTTASVEKMEERYRRAGFERASKNLGHTFVRFGIKMPPDHILAKGFVVEEAGKLAEATASDHLPIWATLMLK
jgi:endonuclease/exonuclease/phosphatase family metal-dependent hydrolase